MPGFTPEWLSAQIVEGIGDAVVFADRDEVIHLWNSGAEAIFGYTAAEAVGQTLRLIIPEKLRARHSMGYANAMGSGVTRYGRELLAVPAMRKDGARISLEFSVLLVRDAAGTVVGAAAVIRDVTARWQQDKALKERLAALEATVGGAGKASS